MGVDLGDQALEMFAGAVGVERGLVRPFLDEDEMAGLFAILEQVIGAAQGLLPRQAHQFGIEGPYRLDMLGLDEVLGDDFEHYAGLGNEKGRPTGRPFYKGSLKQRGAARLALAT